MVDTICVLVLGSGLAGTQGKGAIWAMALALNRDHKIFDGRGLFFAILFARREVAGRFLRAARVARSPFSII